MQLKNDPSGIDQLYDCISKYYIERNRKVWYLNSGVNGTGPNEGDHYFVSVFIDKKHAIRYTIPTAIRTFAGLRLGVGPEYIPLKLLIDDAMGKIVSIESTTEAVEHNLRLLDRYLGDLPLF